MLSLSKGRYRVRLAEGADDVARAQELRYLAFVAARRGGGEGGRDADEFDTACAHALVEETASGRLVACFRLLPLASGREIARSYAARYYELSALASFPGKLVELGRFCVHPAWRDADVLRVAWGAMTAYVDREGVELLFGCASFRGTRAEAHADAFALLTDRHLAPRRWGPGAKAPEVVRFARRLAGRKPDPARALKAMPPLLKAYLAMGGWVSDHAVVDRDLGTMHVFTGLEIGKVPPARAQTLRALAL